MMLQQSQLPQQPQQRPPSPMSPVESPAEVEASPMFYGLLGEEMSQQNICWDDFASDEVRGVHTYLTMSFSAPGLPHHPLCADHQRVSRLFSSRSMKIWRPYLMAATSSPLTASTLVRQKNRHQHQT